MTDLIIHDPGSVVLIGDGTAARVIAVMIRTEFNVQYLVAWFVDHVRHEEWIDSVEINDDSEAPALRLGFHQPRKD